jgi:ribosomal protein S21
MIYATKKQGESNERLMNRFKQVIQRSRLLYKAKQEKFHKKKPTKKFVRKSAVMRSHHRAIKARAEHYS